LALLLDQTRWANLTAWRDAGWVFFAVVMPVGLYALMASMYGDVGFRPNGMAMVFFFACGMAAYGAGVTAFVNMPEAVATQRDRGVLKRLRGTPLGSWQYLAGRTASVLWIALLTAVLVFAVAIVFFGAKISIEGLPMGLGVVVLGTLTLAACGYALAAVAPSGKAMGVISLAILLPLSFFSDVFLIGDTPEWIGTVGSIFPLRHFVHGLAAVLNPDGPTVPWTNLAVMSAWLVAAALVAVRWFRWEPKR
jgi:ABC-type multidrug transport system permease subunit